MNAKMWVPLAAALMLGLAAALMAGRLLHGMKAGTSEPRVSVIVARVAIAPGESITAEQLDRMQIAAKAAPPESFTDPLELVGRVTSAPVIEGQPFLRTLLAPKGAKPGLSALVPPGMRAVTVDVSESGGVAGLLTPGSHVDAVVTAINRDNENKTITRTLVQNLKVAAVGQRLTAGRAEGDKDNAAPRTVTLLATPHDAEVLDLALTTSRVRLVLRAPNDSQEAVDDGVMLAELRGQDGYQPAPATTPVAAPQPVASQPVAAGPTTRPDVFAKAPEPPSARMVTVIQGAEERHVTFTEPRPEAKNSAVTDANSQQLAVPQ